MTYTIQYATRVIDDLQNAYDYYIKQDAPTATLKFLDDIEDTFNTIKRNPYISAVRYGNIRYAIPIKHFLFLYTIKYLRIPIP